MIRIKLNCLFSFCRCVILSQNQENAIFLTYVADSTPDSRKHFGVFLGVALIQACRKRGGRGAGEGVRPPKFSDLVTSLR